ncbi:hypothetical protein BC826DRAFT_970544 [Russula brevipes]|nr:hypothetical protein BC826DRAFT_970544 [Russula brevipes]
MRAPDFTKRARANKDSALLEEGRKDTHQMPITLLRNHFAAQPPHHPKAARAAAAASPSPYCAASRGGVHEKCGWGTAAEGRARGLSRTTRWTALASSRRSSRLDDGDGEQEKPARFFFAKCKGKITRPHEMCLGKECAPALTWPREPPGAGPTVALTAEAEAAIEQYIGARQRV